MIRADLAYERDGAIALITLDRPQKANAFRTQTYDEFLSILAEIASEHSIKVVVITGAGRAFCSGADLSELAAVTAQGEGEEHSRRTLPLVQEITLQIAQLPQIVLAALNGPAIGFGAGLAITCDLRIASTAAYFELPEARRGLFVTNGVTSLLPRLVGQSRALDLIVTGRTISAWEALEWGLVSEVTEPTQLEARVGLLAEQIAGQSRTFLRLVKSLVRESGNRELAYVLELEKQAGIDCWSDPDNKDRVMAFRTRDHSAQGMGPS